MGDESQQPTWPQVKHWRRCTHGVSSSTHTVHTRRAGGGTGRMKPRCGSASIPAEELRQLQSQVPADPFPAIRALLERELGQPLEDVFLDFDEEPIASASITSAHPSASERTIVLRAGT